MAALERVDEEQRAPSHAARKPPLPVAISFPSSPVFNATSQKPPRSGAAPSSSPGSHSNVRPPIGRLLMQPTSSREGRTTSGVDGSGPSSSSSEVLTRLGGVINSRNSVHRGPPSSARSSTSVAGQQSIQHDFEMLNLYKQMRREEDNQAASYSSPYKFVDDAVDEDSGSVSKQVRDTHQLEQYRLNVGGLEDWIQKMTQAVEQRKRGARGRSLPRSSTK
mmetsp:Transcript_47344/g.90395  ORF Transcript_47344/g.90395 Transcript_47344/m.90395 type:complete len:220 (+) Transcript_47344:146-805(+)|eukprot:CAMPEP_0114225714 /NCGR_PEP_ID=MMETSP0058-20121206/824_1 /TAXON_ID=36894 /ORGANISM="Pyramimonas parkeae, CCMP726" /LENGTH=219 /DNA_ID=CAMNT_0001336347 /DNA_START=107 /DNA_END=766 /DNA_ORIENTATION=+